MMAKISHFPSFYLIFALLSYTTAIRDMRNELYDGYKTVFAVSVGPPLDQPAFPDYWIPFTCRKELLTLGGNMDSCSSVDQNLQAPQTAVFSAPGRDIYLFTVFATSTSDLKIVLAGLEDEIGISRSVVNWMRSDTEKFSGNFIVDLPSGSELTMEYLGHIYPRRLNTWTGVSLTGCMEPIVAFNVGTSDDLDQPGKVEFENAMVNTGSYDMDAATFVCPLSGLYYFSVNLGVYGTGLTKVRLTRNNEKWIQLSHNLGEDYENDTISAETLMELDEGDLVRVELVKGGLRSTYALQETSFMGFLYSPRNTDPAAWLLYKTDMSDVNTDREGLMTFDSERLLHGVTLDRTRSTVRIPASGLYHVHISVGCEPGSVLQVAFIANGFIHRHMLIKHMTDNFRSRSVHTGSYVIRLSAGDEIGVWKTLGLGLFGTRNMETSFMGFRIA